MQAEQPAVETYARERGSSPMQHLALAFLLCGSRRSSVYRGAQLCSLFGLREASAPRSSQATPHSKSATRAAAGSLHLKRAALAGGGLSSS